MSNVGGNPAETAGRLALERMLECLENGQSFRLEAGAGAGKTYSLEKALRHLIDHKGANLLRRKQQIGCITFTNVAKDQITSRIQAHPSVRPETVHGFCWSILQDFQTALREFVPSLPTWNERLADVDGIGTRRVNYELGYPGVTDEQVLLRHEDVLALMIRAMDFAKFRRIFTERYPILLIDEYQDTDAGFIDALKKWFWDRGEGPLVGLFGDHWQKIYGDGCGLVDHEALQVIEKNANFRSVGAVVHVLNQMRPELPQVARNPEAPGEARVFHTNKWLGVRRTGQGGGHWTGDTTPEAAQAYFQHVQNRLRSEGWDFSVEKTKILMLSHSVLAGKQGYASIPPIYGKFRDPWLKKEDPHIKFMTDHLEPACAAFEEQHYGKMIAAFGEEMPRISRHEDKVAWSKMMTELIALRQTGTVGDVVDFITAQPQMRLPAALEEREEKLAEVGLEPVEGESRSVTQLRKLRNVPYKEMIALDLFIDGFTPFATKHGVKGAEFENVLVIVGRGWNQYNFSQMLEWIENGPPEDKKKFFESNRNLFYVACSRPKIRLALLFTQVLSEKAMNQLTDWFGEGNVIALPEDPTE